jgi:hypothetical protein
MLRIPWCPPQRDEWGTLVGGVAPQLGDEVTWSDITDIQLKHFVFWSGYKINQPAYCTKT